MATYNAICVCVEGGDTFRTLEKTWIRLARYDAPKEGKPGYYEAKRLLTYLISGKEIVYEQVSALDGQVVAEVWQDGKNVNDLMINSGYKKKK